MANSQPFAHRVAGFFNKLVDLGDGTHAEQVYVANGPSTVTTSGGAANREVIVDPISGSGATVSQFHNADNQTLPGTAYGILAGGVAQTLNAAGNLDRQRGAGTDQVALRGVITGAATFVQEILSTTTTSVAPGALTATLAMANTAGFQVGGTLNFEPTQTSTPSGKYESATITAVVANTSVTVAFPTGGALYTHTQPYLVQTFLGNQERDFSGEGQIAQGIGAAVAAEFESNSGGPPLANGLPSGWTIDADRNVQGKNSVSAAITATVAGDVNLVFTGNPWVNGLVPGQSVLLSVGAAGAAVEEVIVSKNNLPAVGAGPVTVKLVNPVVTSGSTFGLYDAFGLGMPLTQSVVGVEDAVIFLFNPSAPDPKKPLSPMVGNYDTAALITHTAAAAGASGADQTNYNGRGVQIGVNITAITGTTPTLQVIVEGKDAASGSYYPLLTSAALNAVGFTTLTVYPGGPVTANVAANQVLPRTWRVRTVIAGTTPAVTATVGASVVV